MFVVRLAIISWNDTRRLARPPASQSQGENVQSRPKGLLGCWGSVQRNPHRSMRATAKMQTSQELQWEELSNRILGWKRQKCNTDNWFQPLQRKNGLMGGKWCCRRSRVPQTKSWFSLMRRSSPFRQRSIPRMTGFMHIVHSAYLKATELISVVRNQLEPWCGLLLHLMAQSLIWSLFRRVWKWSARSTFKCLKIKSVTLILECQKSIYLKILILAMLPNI